MRNNLKYPTKKKLISFLDDDGSIIKVEQEIIIEYSVYVLFYEDKPIYVGCTSDIENRLRQHRSTKIFNEYQIIYSDMDKSKAYKFESICILFLNSINDCKTFNKRTGWIRGKRISVLVNKKLQKQNYNG